MGFFKKRWVAVTLCLVMVAAALAVGILRTDTEARHQPGNPSAAAQWGRAHADAYHWLVVDEAGLLSEKSVELLAAAEASLDYSHEAVCALYTVEQTPSDMEAAARAQAQTMELGEMDALLLVTAEGQWTVIFGEKLGQYVDEELQQLFRTVLSDRITEPETQLQELFTALPDWYGQRLPIKEQSAPMSTVGLFAGSFFLMVLIPLLFAAAVITAVVNTVKRLFRK